MKYKNNILRLCCLGFFFGGQTANAQLYGDINGETTVSFDLCTCSTGSQVPNQGFSGASLTVSYNGNIYATAATDRNKTNRIVPWFATQNSRPTLPPVHIPQNCHYFPQTPA